jgi:hypothetical protein
VDWPQAKSKKPIVFAVLGAVVLIAAIWAIASTSGEAEPTPTVTPQAATPAVEDATGLPAPKNPMDSPRQPAEAAEQDEPESGDAPAGDAPAEDMPSTAPPSGNFEDIFKKNVKKDR